MAQVQDSRITEFQVILQPANKRGTLSDIYPTGEVLRGSIQITLKETIQVELLELLYQGVGKIDLSVIPPNTNLNQTNQSVALDQSLLSAKPAFAGDYNIADTTYVQNVKRNQMAMKNYPYTQNQKANSHTQNGARAPVLPPQLTNASEVYLNEVQNVFGLLPGQCMTLPAGKNQVSFSYRIPRHVPSSFTGTYGSVTYLLKAAIATKFGGANTIVPFLVRNPLQSANYTGFVRPTEMRMHKNYKGSGIKVFRSGQVESVFGVSKMVYAPGETIMIEGHVANRAPVHIYAAQVSIVQRIMYTTSRGIRAQESRPISSVKDEYNIPIGHARKWSQVKLFVPTDAVPSYLEGCSLIELYYELQFEVFVRGNKHMTAAIPVVLGLADPLLSSTEQAIQLQSSLGLQVPLNRTSIKGQQGQAAAGIYEGVGAYQVPVGNGKIRAEVQLPTANATPSGSARGTISRPFGEMAARQVAGVPQARASVNLSGTRGLGAVQMQDLYKRIHSLSVDGQSDANGDSSKGNDQIASQIQAGQGQKSSSSLLMAAPLSTGIPLEPIGIANLNTSTDVERISLNQNPSNSRVAVIAPRISDGGLDSASDVSHSNGILKTGRPGYGIGNGRNGSMVINSSFALSRPEQGEVQSSLGLEAELQRNFDSILQGEEGQRDPVEEAIENTVL